MTGRPIWSWPTQEKRLPSDRGDGNDPDYTHTNITYYYSGKDKLIKEQGVLRSKLDAAGYDKVGGAIHHVYSWYALMTK